MTPPSELKRLAEGATPNYPGPWTLEGPFERDGKRWGGSMAIVAQNHACVVHQFHTEEWEQLAAYIAAADPQTILGLLAEVESSRERDETLRNLRNEALQAHSDTKIELHRMTKERDRLRDEKWEGILAMEARIAELEAEVETAKTTKQAALQEWGSLRDTVMEHCQRLGFGPPKEDPLKTACECFMDMIAELEKEAAELRQFKRLVDPFLRSHIAKIDSPEA